MTADGETTSCTINGEEIVLIINSRDNRQKLISDADFEDDLNKMKNTEK